MAYYRRDHGYVGLGDATIFRTAAQVANDIETYGQSAGEIAKSGGLFDMKNVFKYSAGQGRLHDLEAGINDAESRIDVLQAQIRQQITNLERLGVANVGTYIGMAAGMLPAIGSIMTMWGMFGGTSGRKQKLLNRANEMITYINQLKKRVEFWSDRIDQLNKEGEILATQFEKGPSAIKVKLVGLKQKTEIRRQKVGSGLLDSTYIRHEDIVDVKDPYMQTYQELEERKDAATGARLPVGFQKIYSPAFKDGPIVAKMTSTSQALKQPVGKQRLVFGGLLSGVGELTTEETVRAFLAMGSIVGVLYLMSRSES